MFRRISRRNVLGYLARFMPLALCSGSVSRMLHAAEAAPDVQSNTALLPSVIHELFPHGGLGDDFYADMAVALGKQMAADNRVSRDVETALTKLAGCCGSGGWEHAGHAARVAALTGIQQETCFQTLKDAAQTLVYRDSRVWQRIGYGGNALAQGGYLTRGFDHIDWLTLAQP
jgi:hypothetical protein